jgi:3-dehydroquinate synthase
MNSMDRIKISHRSSASSYEVIVGEGLLSDSGQWARDRLGDRTRKAAIISNTKVFSSYGKTVEKSLTKAGFDVSVWLMKDGERNKNLTSLSSALDHLSKQRFARGDVVIALGGGVVGDLAGFAAAVYLRGIRILQIPTTFLAMIDSSVGGKTGINTAAGKNLVGAFHRPSGVLIDIETLLTLPRRELTAGYCEAIKQGAVSGNDLFSKTNNFLTNTDRRGLTANNESLLHLIASQIAFKASIVKQDETEQIGRIDRKSRKILNFGHTFGHALEKATNFRRLRHGEAVGYGILMAGELSKSLDLLSQNELNLLYDVVHRAGRLPRVTDINPDSIFDALRYDKKSSGGKIDFILLKAIGKPVIISEKDIPRSALTRAVKTILKAS